MFGIVAICDLSHMSDAFQTVKKIYLQYLFNINGMIDWHFYSPFLKIRELRSGMTIWFAQGHTEEKE